MKNPGIYSFYPSSMVSEYWGWFREMGYPELDIVSYPDGEWAIIEYLNRPIIPSLTKWNFVLSGIRNQEKSYEWVKSWCDQLALDKRHVWERQEEFEKAAIRRQEEEERRAQDFADRAHLAITQNADLMERIAKGGLREMDPLRILNNIPRSKLGKEYKENKLWRD